MMTTIIEPPDALSEPRGRLNFVSPKLKLDELFVSWLCLPETQQNIGSLLKDIEAGVPVHRSNFAQYRSPGLSPLSPTHIPHKHSPTHSPSSSPTFDRERPIHNLSKNWDDASPQPAQTHKTSSLHKPSPGRRPSTSSSPHSSPPPSPPPSGLLGKNKKPLPIPQFYFPPTASSKSSIDKDFVDQRKAKLSELFQARGGALNQRDFLAVTKLVAGLPGFFNGVLFRRLDKRNSSLVTLHQFDHWWNSGDAQSLQLSDRIFNFFRNGAQRDYIIYDDLRETVRELMDTHPGLEFLKSTPEFQEKYADTVIYRIFYTVNLANNGKLTAKELRNSDLPDVMLSLDEEQDINKVTRYFSYEHFYVLYCKFWELDTDHNQLINKDDLLRYGNHALTYRIVERIFAQVPRKFASEQPDKMNFEDFVWFCLSEEDKMTDTAMDYWFKCIDLDSDGFVSQYEMEFFYTEQVHRMTCIQMEPVNFLDILCQMLDMIKPDDKQRVTLRDLKRCQMGSNFFNVLFNLNKFTAMEQKDPFLSRGEEPESDWDKFARIEYDRLSAEDDTGGEMIDDEDSWQGGYSGGTRESPF